MRPSAALSSNWSSQVTYSGKGSIIAVRFLFIHNGIDSSHLVLNDLSLTASGVTGGEAQMGIFMNQIANMAPLKTITSVDPTLVSLIQIPRNQTSKS